MLYKLINSDNYICALTDDEQLNFSGCARIEITEEEYETIQQKIRNFPTDYLEKQCKYLLNNTTLEWDEVPLTQEELQALHTHELSNVEIVEKLEATL